MIIIDGNNAVAGRLAAFVAKTSLSSTEEVAVINAEKIVISGNADKIFEKYNARRGMRNMSDPEKSAKWPRRPDMLFKKIISGMMPKHSSRGAAALKRIKIYLGVPKEFEGKPAQATIKTSDKLPGKSIDLLKLSQRLGWHSPV